MPIFNRTTETLSLANTQGRTDITAELTVGVGLRAAVHAKTVFTAEMTGGHATVTFQGGTTVTARLAIGAPTATLVFAGSTTMTATLSVFRYETFALNFVVDILPPAADAASYKTIWLPRLKVDGVEVPITGTSQYTEAAGSLSASLTVTLARPADRSLFVPDAEIEFGIGRLVAGAWDAATFDVLFSTGNTQQRSHTIGWQNNGPTDAVTVTIESDVSARITQTPQTDCVIYDPQKQTLNVSDFEVLRDTEGRQYVTELKPISGMTLYDLLYEVIVARCGFAGYATNIPDFPVARADCAIGRPWIEAVRGVLGIFSPVIFIEPLTGILWIVDASIAMPAGFPPARTVAISDYGTLRLSDAQKQLDGFIVRYTQDKRDFDYITTRTETDTIWGEETDTFIEKEYREYRKFSMPGVILRDELYSTVTTVTAAMSLDISETRETFTFDELSRLTLREKTVRQRLPLIDTGMQVMQDVTAETEALSYAAHPYDPRSQYIAQRETNVTGLIVVDNDDQQLGEPFRQPYVKSYRSGNLKEGQTIEDGLIHTRIETAEPLRNGQVRVSVKEIDHLTNTVAEDVTENRTGDIAIRGTQPEQSRVLVLDDENSLRSTKALEDLNIGELSIREGIPLARRLLLRRKTKQHEGSITVVGYESGMRKGLPIALTGRGGEALGNYLVVGRRVTAGRDIGANIELEVEEI